MFEFKKNIDEFPRNFWILAGATFIDSVGATLVFPFFALYITQRFDVGMTQAGILLAIFSISGLMGSTLGGALTDKFGRRRLVMCGLVFSALSTLSMGFVNDLSLFYILAAGIGLLSDIAGPARQAMVADLLPAPKRARGFGVMRVVHNLAWVVGPTIGGFLAGRSYLSLFILDAILSSITALVVFTMLPETNPAPQEGRPQASLMTTLAGYRIVARNTIFLAFLATSMLMIIGYQQIYSTLSVFLRDIHGIPTQKYGMLMSLNAVAVVLFQFRVTRQTEKQAPMFAMAYGTVFILAGLLMFGFVSTYSLFVCAMLLVTVGEMVIIPVGQALVARMAPEDMRGRYMAFYSWSWAIPATVGPWAAGLIMDNISPHWVWFAAGILSAFSAAGFLLLHLKTREQVSSDESQAHARRVLPSMVQ